MSVITTGTHPKALMPGVHKWFGRFYDEHEVEYTDLFEMEKSTRNFEEDVESTGYGLAQIKPEGGAIAYDSESQGATTRYVHVAYALGYIVTLEEIRDNQYPTLIKRRSRNLARSMRETKEIVAANVYNRGFSPSYLGGDGKELFATNHPTLNGSQSNELATPADISEAAIEDMVTQIAEATNSRGLKIKLMPRCLVVPPQLWFEANRIMKSVLQNDTANNAVNVLKALNVLPRGIKMNHYLSDPDAWFIRTNAPTGMTGFDRDKLGPEQENEFDTRNLKVMAYERFSFGWSDWRGCYASPGS